jgi:hypothetical protein
MVANLSLFADGFVGALRNAHHTSSAKARHSWGGPEPMHALIFADGPARECNNFKPVL